MTNNTTAAQVLADATQAAQDALGVDRSTAFDVAIAAMIAEDPETMRRFFAAAHAQYLSATAAA